MSKLTLQSTVALLSGHTIPALGFGVFESTRAGESTTAALQAGYRHIDSARYYENEAAVVEAVVAFQAGAGAAAEPVFLTTKVKSTEYAFDGKCEEAIEESIGVAAKAGLVWDLFLLHDPTGTSDERIKGWKVLLKVQSEGKVKSVGVSNFTEVHLEQFRQAGLPLPDVNQIEVHPWCQRQEVVDYCQANGVVVQAYCPLVRGDRADDPTLTAIATETTKNWAQVLIRWSLQRGFVPLPKSDTPSRIAANADVFDFELSDEQMARLDGLDLGEAGVCSWNPKDDGVRR